MITKIITFYEKNILIIFYPLALLTLEIENGQNNW